MTADAKLAFGTELEVLLKPKEQLITRLEKTCPGWAAKFEEAKAAESEAAVQQTTVTNTDADTNTTKAQIDALRLKFREQISDVLTTLGKIPTGTSSDDYQKWSVVDEPTLDEVPEYCRVEVVSRTIASDDVWQEEFDTVFYWLNQFCHIVCTTGCSMHVHVSPSAKPKGQQGRWTPGNLNKIMKALSYFTSPINKIMPAERKENPWAMQNMLSEDVAKAKPQLSIAYEQIQTRTWKPLFDIYDSSMRRDLDKRQAFAIMGSCRYVAWNFAHIPGSCGTVEFRQCTGVTTSAAANYWTSFTLGFLYSAAFLTNLDWAQVADQNTHPSVEDLESFTKAGIQGLEPTCRGSLGSLKEDTSPATVWSAEETKKILEKKALLERRGSPESYPEKFDRTPEGTPTGSPTASPRH